MNIEVNKSAKAYAKAEITILATAKEVFDVLSDIERWPDWQSDVSQATLEGELVEGTTFRWKAGGSPIRSKLHTVHPPTEIGWTGRILWITAIHNWVLKEQGGQTSVLVEESMGGFLSGLMKKTLETGMQKSLQELKATVENKY